MATVTPARGSGSSPAPAPGRARDHGFVDSLRKGLEVLNCFSRAHPRLTLSEVARHIDATPASARRALITLRDLGYLAHDGKRFRLQPRALLLANAYLSSSPTPTLVQPLLDALAERGRESASVAKLLDGDAIIIARSTARRSLVVGLTIGSRLPAYCSATGRVLLAGLSPRASEKRLRAMTMRPLTPRTVTTLPAALAHVQQCRELGYAVCDGELELGVRSMAVPLLDRAGRTVAAMSIAVRAERMATADFVRNFLPSLRQAQARLRDWLGED